MKPLAETFPSKGEVCLKAGLPNIRSNCKSVSVLSRKVLFWPSWVNVLGIKLHLITNFNGLSSRTMMVQKLHVVCLGALEVLLKEVLDGRKSVDVRAGGVGGFLDV